MNKEKLTELIRSSINNVSHIKIDNLFSFSVTVDRIYKFQFFYEKFWNVRFINNEYLVSEYLMNIIKRVFNLKERLNKESDK